MNKLILLSLLVLITIGTLAMEQGNRNYTIDENEEKISYLAKLPKDMILLMINNSSYPQKIKILEAIKNNNKELQSWAENEIKKIFLTKQLFHLINRGEYQILQTFIQNFINKGVDINSKDENGIPLIVALTSGNRWLKDDRLLPFFNFLTIKGLNLNATDPSGNTALHIAVENNSYDVAHFLINTGANIDIKNKYDETPLDIAIKKNRIL